MSLVLCQGCFKGAWQAASDFFYLLLPSFLGNRETQTETLGDTVIVINMLIHSFPSVQKGDLHAAAQLRSKYEHDSYLL